MKTVNVGIIGCGNISGIYFENLINVFKNVNVVCCADINAEASKVAAEKWNIKAVSVDEMLGDDTIEIIVNLTTPQSHYSLCKQILKSGKHVYVEKPLSLEFEHGKELVSLAEEKNLMIGGAPDTFLGAGIQTSIKLIDDGFIGTPLGAAAFMMCRGHESWHPNPDFYYKAGGGPMFDMGPYYLTALLNLLGPVEYVAGVTSKSFKTRTVTSQPNYGKIVDVEVNTHIAGLLRFQSGAVGNIITSFDVVASDLPLIEIYGTRGTLSVPDPNTFGGPVKLTTLDGGGAKEMPLTHSYAENSRGIGVSDMAQNIIDGERNNRANGKLALHVLEIMGAMDLSSNSKAFYEMKSTFEKPKPLSMGVIKGYIK